MSEVYVSPKTDNDVAIDSVVCPHCGSEMVRNKMDNPYTIHGRSYICHVCGAEEFVSPNTEEEIY